MAVRKPPMSARLKGPRGVKAKPVCFVVHTAEGCRTAECTIDFLAPRGISVPYSVDPKKTLAMVPDGYLGYGHAAGLTGRASGVELAGFAAWSRKQWLGEGREMVRQAGRLAAYVLSEHGGYRITEGLLRHRVIGHAQDARFGGTSDHWDPGPGFPYDVCRKDALAWAKEDEMTKAQKLDLAFADGIRRGSDPKAKSPGGNTDIARARRQGFKFARAALASGTGPAQHDHEVPKTVTGPAR